MFDSPLQQRPNIQARNSKHRKCKDNFFLVRWLRLHVFITLFRTLKRQILLGDFLNVVE